MSGGGGDPLPPVSVFELQVKVEVSPQRQERLRRAVHQRGHLRRVESRRRLNGFVLDEDHRAVSCGGELAVEPRKGLRRID